MINRLRLLSIEKVKEREKSPKTLIDFFCIMAVLFIVTGLAMSVS